MEIINTGNRRLQNEEAETLLARSNVSAVDINPTAYNFSKNSRTVFKRNGSFNGNSFNFNAISRICK